MRSPPAPIRRAARAAVLVAGVAAALPACANPMRDTAGAPPVLLVLNAQDATLSRVPVGGARPADGDVSVDAGGWQVAAGPAGSAVVLHTAGPRAGALTRVVRVETGWAARPLPLGPEAEITRLGGDGRTVVAAYRPRIAPRGARRAPCRLALLDPASGVARTSHALCGPDEDVLSLAVATGGPGAAPRRRRLGGAP